MNSPVRDATGGDVIIRPMTEAELDPWSRDRIMAGVIDDFKHRAFVRYAETWGMSGGITTATLRRGLTGNRRLGTSIGGMLGSQRAALARAEDGSWRVADMRQLYPYIRRWPKAGILRAREVARELRRQRDAEQAHQRTLAGSREEDRRDVADTSQGVSS